MFRTDNPLQDFYDYEYEQEQEIAKYPKCSCCEERVVQEKAVYYNEEWYCEDCEDELWQSIKEKLLKDVERS